MKEQYLSFRSSAHILSKLFPKQRKDKQHGKYSHGSWSLSWITAVRIILLTIKKKYLWELIGRKTVTYTSQTCFHLGLQQPWKLWVCKKYFIIYVVVNTPILETLKPARFQMNIPTWGHLLNIYVSSSSECNLQCNKLNTVIELYLLLPSFINLHMLRRLSG